MRDSCSTSSCSSRPGSAGCLISARRVSSRARNATADIRQPRAHISDDARDGIQPLAHERDEAFAFALPRGEHVGKRAIEQIERGLPQSFLIDFLMYQHAGKFEQAGEIGRQVRKAPAQRFRRAFELVDHCVVHADLRHRRHRSRENAESHRLCRA